MAQNLQLLALAEVSISEIIAKRLQQFVVYCDVL